VLIAYIEEVFVRLFLFFYWLLLLPFSGFSQELPVICSERDHRIRAICSNSQLGAMATEAEIRFLNALSNTATIDEWKSHIQKKIAWSADYARCGVSTDVKAIEACLLFDLRRFADSFQPVSSVKSIDDLRSSVRIKSDSMLELAKARLRACAENKANLLDDGISPARDIAIGVSTTCRPMVVNLVSIASSKLEMSAFSSIGLRYEEESKLVTHYGSPDAFVETVLESRAKKRSVGKNTKNLSSAR
jgi:hypothetical protein